jgi:phytoene desaturase
VINGDFGHVARSLLPRIGAAALVRCKIAKARLSCSTFMMYLGIEGDVPLAHHTILLTRDYDRNIREIGSGVLSTSPRSMSSMRARPTRGRRRRPLVLYVLAPSAQPPSKIDWQREAPRYRALILERLKLLGLDDLEAASATSGSSRRSTGATSSRSIRAPPSTWRTTCADALFSPHNRFGNGVYLVGGGTHPGSGLPVIFEGARITAGLLRRRHRHREQAGSGAPPLPRPLRDLRRSTVVIAQRRRNRSQVS